MNTYTVDECFSVAENMQDRHAKWVQAIQCRRYTVLRNAVETAQNQKFTVVKKLEIVYNIAVIYIKHFGRINPNGK